jgi:hypothetical protein
LADWLLANNSVGWVKTALLSGLIGMVVLGVFGVSYGESSQRFLFIATGFPILWLVRSWYWSHRRTQFLELIERNDATSRSNSKS